MAEKRILIIDGDFLAHRAAAIGETRTVEVKHIKSGRTKEFETRTAFKKFLLEKNVPYVESDYEYKDKQYPKESYIVEKIIKNTIQNLNNFTWADHTEVHLGASGQTFRNYLMLPSKYKDNRAAMIRPVHLTFAKELLSRKHNAKTYDGYESDDTISIRAYEESAKGNYPIIATIDKDAYQAQGIAILDWYKEPWKIVDISSLGELYKDSKDKVRGSGLLFLCYQILCGDVTDTYKPYELSNLTYGSARAYKALVNCKTEKDALESVISEYKRMYPKTFSYVAHNQQTVYNADWEFILQLYFKCAYMKRSWNDGCNFWTYAKQYGIEKEQYHG